jgi:hypothetical protein
LEVTEVTAETPIFRHNAQQRVLWESIREPALLAFKSRGLVLLPVYEWR